MSTWDTRAAALRLGQPPVAVPEVFFASAAILSLKRGVNDERYTITAGEGADSVNVCIVRVRSHAGAADGQRKLMSTPIKNV